MSSSYRTKSDEEKRTLLARQGILVKDDKTTKRSIENDPDVEEKSDETGNTLIIAFLFMLVFQLGNRIFGKLQTYPMYNYPLFLNMLMVAIYIPICFAYVIPMLAFSNVITKEQQEIPKFKFFVMGGFDSLAGIMQTFAVNYISNASLMVLVQQSAIPISMVISTYTLQSVYTKSQYAGACVVLFGIVVVLIPNFFDSSSSSSASSTTDGSSQLLWLLVLVISCVPMCLSSVYKEKALGETEIDIMYLNGWVAVFQFLIAIPLCIPSSQVLNMPLSEIMPNMYGGMLCWMGIDSITPDNNPHNLPLDDCRNAPTFVTIYLFFNVVYNFLIVVILKLGSANIMWMASTVIVPLSNVAFSLHFMPGHRPLRFWDIIGLVVIMTGLIIYRFSKDLFAAYDRLTGRVSRDGDVISEEENRRSRRIAKVAERKQLRYMGINQMEHLQSLVESRVQREQAILLFRSPGQIRSTYLAKIGIPPSPMISMGPGRRPSLNLENPNTNYNAIGFSPMKLNSGQRNPSFKTTSAAYGNSRDNSGRGGSGIAMTQQQQQAQGRKQPAEV